MNHLKKENINTCFSLLREYLDETPKTNKKETAVLALDQLQKITAGTGTEEPTEGCHGKPMVAPTEG